MTEPASIEPGFDRDVDRRAAELGRQIFALVRKQPMEGSRFERMLMNAGMRDESVKTQLFRFIDVLPVLSGTRQVNSHLCQYLLPVGDRLPGMADWVLQHVPREGWLADRLAGAAMFSTRRMARRFIAAADLAEAVKAIQKLRRHQLAFTLDLLGEAVLSENEAGLYQKQYIELIEGLAREAATWPAVPLIDESAGAPLPRVNVSIKLSSLFSQFDPIDPARTQAQVLERLRPILRAARSAGTFVNIDMEQYAFKDVTLAIFRDVMAEEEFRDWADVGIAIQAYLRDTADDLATLAIWAERRGAPIWIRLVKGAYWDFETIAAAQHGWTSPVWEIKARTDASYESHTAFLMERHDLLRPAIASHNVRSLAVALALAEKFSVPARGFEFQMLHGMADPIKAALAKMGHRVRVYTPFGPLLPGMAYLVRRLLENTSNDSFLRAGFHEHVSEEQLLMNPVETLRRRSIATDGDGRITISDEQHKEAPASFVNEPLADFSKDAARNAMAEAIKSVGGRFGASYPLVIGGQRLDSGKWIDSRNPSHRGQVLGRVAAATVAQAIEAIAAAKFAFAEWKKTTAQRRAESLFRAAAILRRRRWELSAWEVYETAKPWREADADVAEAIDYCEYYGREMLRLSQPRRRDVPGEENEYFYEPRGVVVTIAPWNFPLAILCGMTTAALVAGNTVVMKPAEQSPIIAAKLMEVFHEAGIPDGVVSYLPGIGEEIGPTLVGHPDVAMIAFTGSRQVGLEIQRQAALTPPGQNHVKRVITEMGGKNAIIIDDDADLDEAVRGVVASAFGYAGQKCSACSRAIVLKSIYPTFVARLVEATRSLKMGPPEEPATFVGPVIDDEAQRRILVTMARARTELNLAYEAELGDLAEQGSYVPPTIFAEVPPDHWLAQEEIFGPVLAVIPATDLDEALKIANSTPYALTGGIFSRSPANLLRARRELEVGNLYINRAITGALVDRQPFGGMKLSGVGSKAGGPDYLTQFMNPRAVTENTFRHGFAPASTAAAEPTGE